MSFYIDTHGVVLLQHLLIERDGVSHSLLSLKR